MSGWKWFCANESNVRSDSVQTNKLCVILCKKKVYSRESLNKNFPTKNAISPIWWADLSTSVDRIRFGEQIWVGAADLSRPTVTHILLQTKQIWANLSRRGRSEIRSDLSGGHMGWCVADWQRQNHQILESAGDDNNRMRCEFDLGFGLVGLEQNGDWHRRRSEI